VAVLALAQDRIQAVRRSCGDEAGEELLAEAAKRVGRELRDRDALLRERGDELVVLVEGVHDVDETARIAQRLREALRGSLHIGKRDVAVTASIGTCTFPDEAADAESLLREAVASRGALPHGSVRPSAVR
jgi:diguanylate cyclase (GGDEF)-like protein